MGPCLHLSSLIQTSSDTRDDRRPGSCQMPGFGEQSSPPAGAVEIGFDPWMIVLQHLFQRADADLFSNKIRAPTPDQNWVARSGGNLHNREARSLPRSGNQV